MILRQLRRIDWGEALFGAPFFVPMIVALCVGIWALSNGQSVHAMVLDTHAVDGGGWSCDIVIPHDIDPSGQASIPCEADDREGELVDAYWVPAYGWDSANDLWVPALFVGPMLIGSAGWVLVYGGETLVYGLYIGLRRSSRMISGAVSLR